MSEESKGIDPYDAVLADLYAKRDQIAQAIAAIESLRGGTSAAAIGARAEDTSKPTDLLGMSIVDAAKTLLAAKRKPLRNPEFATLFKAGGLVLTSVEPANTIGSVLTRRFNEVGDVVRVDRGTWGLKEWYPGRSFGKKADNGDKGEEAEAASEAKPEDKPKRGNPFAGKSGVKASSEGASGGALKGLHELLK